jgi:hypothetical protein
MNKVTGYRLKDQGTIAIKTISKTRTWSRQPLCQNDVTTDIQRIRMNYELNNLIKNADIVRFVKSKRMAWLGHMMRMEGKKEYLKKY